MLNRIAGLCLVSVSALLVGACQSAGTSHASGAMHALDVRASFESRYCPNFDDDDSDLNDTCDVDVAVDFVADSTGSGTHCEVTVRESTVLGRNVRKINWKLKPPVPPYNTSFDVNAGVDIEDFRQILNRPQRVSPTVVSTIYNPQRYKRRTNSLKYTVNVKWVDTQNPANRGACSKDPIMVTRDEL